MTAFVFFIAVLNLLNLLLHLVLVAKGRSTFGKADVLGTISKAGIAGWGLYLLGSA